MIGKGGKGTKIWWEMITQAVKEKQAMRKELEELGYKFESAGDGSLTYKVTYPNGIVVLADYKNPLYKIYVEAKKGTDETTT